LVEGQDPCQQKDTLGPDQGKRSKADSRRFPFSDIDIQLQLPYILFAEK
jgi:hypothetical protein